MGIKKDKPKKFAQTGSLTFWRFVIDLPVNLPIVLILFSVYCMTLLLFGELSSSFVSAGGLVIGTASIFVLKKRHSETKGVLKKEDKVAILLLFCGLIVWAGLNLKYTSQNIFVYRDPALYNNNAAWLVEHEGLEIYESDVFGQEPAIRGDAISLESLDNEGRLYAHGGQLLPVLMGLVGRAVGDEHLFKANVLIAALALLAFYGFCRFFLRPWFALGATALLAILLPMIYFARDSYTEPLALLVVFSALSLVNIALREKSKRLWFIAGLAAGASTLTRIDAYLLVASFVLFAGVQLSLSKRQRNDYLQTANFMCGLFVTSFLGWLLYTRLGAAYYQMLHTQFKQQLLLIIISVIFGVLLTILFNQKALMKKLDKSQLRQNIPKILLALSILGLIALASRPLWFTSYSETQNPVVAILQKAEGITVEPRLYVEQSLNWLWWYMGPLAFLLGVGGFLYVLNGAARDTRRHMGYVAFLFVFSITTVVYLANPSITPDQVWAARRYLPIVFPGLIFLCFLLLQENYRKIQPKLRYSIVFILLILLFIPPLFISQPIIRAKTFQNQLASVHEICSFLPANASALLVGINGQNMLQAIRTYCDVPVEWVHEPDKDMLRDAYNSASFHGYQPVVIMNNNDLAVLPAGAQLSTISAVAFDDLERTLFHPPRRVMREARIILAGKIQPDGNIIPVN